MKLYTFEIAPNPRRVELFLQHKGVKLDTQTIDLSKGEQFAEDFQAVNPACTVPVLVLEDGTTLTEVVAICDFLESVHPQKSLMGNTVLERAQVLQWMHRNFIEGFISVAEMLRNYSKAFKDRALPGPHKIPQLPELVERGRSRLHHYFETLDQYLEDRSHMVGDALTQADIDVFVTCDFALWVKETVPVELENLSRWRQRTAEALGQPLG